MRFVEKYPSRGVDKGQRVTYHPHRNLSDRLLLATSVIQRTHSSYDLVMKRQMQEAVLLRFAKVMTRYFRHRPPNQSPV